MVKICGLTGRADLEAAREAGADFVGFVFAPSRRQVTPAQVRAITQGLGPKGRPGLVGVFVDPDPAELEEVIDLCRLDRVQLSGTESPELCRRLRVPVWKTVHLAGPEALAALDRYAGLVEFFHLDAYVPGRYGGTGTAPDWGLAAQVARAHPAILAGGLTPENVAAAVGRVRPAGVDVSSGVETAGVKDPAKIRAFVRRARKAALMLKQ